MDQHTFSVKGQRVNLLGLTGWDDDHHHHQNDDGGQHCGSLG